MSSLRRLKDLLPEFVAELSELLLADGRKDVSIQLEEVLVEKWSYDSSADAAYIYLQSPRSLNAVEQNIIGVKHGETVATEHPYWVNLDTDNFGRLKGIELLRGGEDCRCLERLSRLSALFIPEKANLRNSRREVHHPAGQYPSAKRDEVERCNRLWIAAL